MEKSKIQLIAIVGETASGKSALAIEIAKRYKGEIIAADSRTIYKEMDIGTAKPQEDEMEGIKHHGLNLVEPGERYTAAQFKQYCDLKIQDIVSRGKLPILVGGTGLYIDGVLFDYSFGEESSSEERSELNNKSIDELTTISQEMKLDLSGQLLKNKRHLIRMIERDGVTENNTNLAYDALLLGYILPKNVLRKRIEKRVEAMFRKGLRKEYNDLKQKYGTNSEAFTGIGYREFAAWESGNASMSEVKREIVKNTMNLAKRQRTWFKRNPHIQWVESEDEALVKVAQFIDN